MWAIILGAVQLAERAARVSHLGCWDGQRRLQICMGNRLHEGDEKIVEPRLTPCLVALAAGDDRGATGQGACRSRKSNSLIGLAGTVYVITSATLNLEVLSSTTTAQARCGKEHEGFE